MAKDVINDAAAKCPTAKLFVSGYSQGAMVARNGVAYANDAAKARVKVKNSIKPQISAMLMTLTGRDRLWRSIPGFAD